MHDSRTCPAGIEKSDQERKAPGWGGGGRLVGDGDVREGSECLGLRRRERVEDKDSGSLVQGRELVVNPLL